MTMPDEENKENNSKMTWIVNHVSSESKFGQNYSVDFVMLEMFWRALQRWSHCYDKSSNGIAFLHKAPVPVVFFLENFRSWKTPVFPPIARHAWAFRFFVFVSLIVWKLWEGKWLALTSMTLAPHDGSPHYKPDAICLLRQVSSVIFMNLSCGSSPHDPISLTVSFILFIFIFSCFCLIFLESFHYVFHFDVVVN